jgi:hypothetical protein
MSQLIDEVRRARSLPPPTVGVGRACEAIGISTSWGYQLIAQDEFPCKTITIRGRSRVLTTSLVSLLETGEP